MKTPPLFCIIFILMHLLPKSLDAQIFTNPDSLGFNIGIKLHLSLGKQRASFYNVSVTAGIFGQLELNDFRFMPGGQLTLNLYSKGLGTSIIDQFNRNGQLDFLTSFYFVTGYEKTDRDNAPREKFVRLFNQLSATTIYHNFDASFYYGTSFLINNHGRNQQIGHAGLNIDQILLGYYNDGFWPFDKIAGDAFDRFWTGGGHLSIGLNSFNIAKNCEWCSEQFVEYSYDRFTGNVQRGYKLSKEILIFGVPQSETKEVFLNRALSSIYLRNLHGNALGFGFFGQCPKFDIQDMLHKMLGYSKHISFSKCTMVFSGSYQYNIFNSIKK